jgi:hypothetical protein
MNEELELLKTVAARLESAGIEYMMSGSMAMAFYSTPRMTRDIDIIIQVSVKDAAMILGLFQSDFYIDQESVRHAIVNRGMFNIIHSDSVIKVDLIVRKNEEYRIEEFSRKRKMTIDGATVWVVAPEDLILSKLVWAKNSQSELQLRDVRRLLHAVTRLDRNYLDYWAKNLGVSDLLEKAKENE